MTKTQATAAGAAAFAAGAPRVPVADPAVQDAIAALPVGSGAARVFRAWLSGWDTANLAAPLQDASA